MSGGRLGLDPGGHTKARREVGEILCFFWAGVVFVEVYREAFSSRRAPTSAAFACLVGVDAMARKVPATLDRA